MVSEMRKQLMAWMETDYSKHTMYIFLMDGKMVAAAFGRARNYGWDGPYIHGASEAHTKLHLSKSIFVKVLIGHFETKLPE